MNDKIKVTLVSKAVAEVEILISCQQVEPGVVQFAPDGKPWATVGAITPRHELGSFKMYPDPVEIKPADKD